MRHTIFIGLVAHRRAFPLIHSVRSFSRDLSKVMPCATHAPPGPTPITRFRRGRATRCRRSTSSSGHRARDPCSRAATDREHHAPVAGEQDASTTGDEDTTRSTWHASTEGRAPMRSRARGIQGVDTPQGQGGRLVHPTSEGGRDHVPRLTHFREKTVGGFETRCERCGDVVTPARRGGSPKRFCTERCRGKAERVRYRARYAVRDRARRSTRPVLVRACRNRCGRPADAPTGPGRTPVFCSEACRRAWWRAHPAARRHYERECPRCGRTFWATRVRQRWCSWSCAARRANRPPRICVTCGVVRFQPRSRDHRNCSAACAAVAAGIANRRANQRRRDVA